MMLRQTKTQNQMILRFVQAQSNERQTCCLFITEAYCTAGVLDITMLQV